MNIKESEQMLVTKLNLLYYVAHDSTCLCSYNAIGGMRLL